MFLKKFVIGTLFLLVLVSVFSCTEEGALVQSQQEKEYPNLFKAPVSDMTPREVGIAHGEIVNIFMNNLFNKELVNNKELKEEFLKNNGTDDKTFKRVFIESVNQYFAERDMNIRMDIKDFSELLCQFNKKESFIDLNSDNEVQVENVEICLKHLESVGLINTETRQICQAQLSRMEKYGSFETVPNRALLTVSDDEYKKAEFAGKVFIEIAINSVETWSNLPENIEISDPELGAWYDWFRSSEKIKAICVVVSDVAGGAIGTAATGGNPYGTLVGAGLASAGYAAWAY